MTRDAGATWKPQRSGFAGYLYGVDFVDAQTGWAVGSEGTILVTHDGGSNWERQRSYTSNLLRGVHFWDAKNGWVVGMYRYDPKLPMMAGRLGINKTVGPRTNL